MEESVAPPQAEPVSNFAKLERVAGFLQNVSITMVAIFALLYYVFPHQSRRVINYINPDRAWFFVALENSANHDLINQRFHTGLIGLNHNELLNYKGVMFLNSDDLAENITLFQATDRANAIARPDGTAPSEGAAVPGNAKSDKTNRTIVGRSEPTTQRGSRVVLVPVSGQCLNVSEVIYGLDRDIEGVWYKTIWAHGNLIDCGRGY